MNEARFYERQESKRVKCHLCFHECLIKDGRRGICGVRENRDGTLFSLVYGKSISEAVDPIEKKPLFHFLPGTQIFSIATVGCNFKCLHCQNYSISQAPEGHGEIPGENLPPERIVFLAQQTGCQSIAYTYTEPTIFLEYAMDTAKLASLAGLKNVFVTNGYITPEALRAIKPYLDGANIDLKSFSDDFYRRVCGARLQPVLDSIRLYKELGIWIEVTTLVIPGYNDSEEELRKIARPVHCRYGSKRTMACDTILSDLQDSGSTEDAPKYPGASEADRHGGGAEIRLPGKRSRSWGRKHVLSWLR